MKLFIKHISFITSFFLGLIILIVVSTSLIERDKANFKLENNPKYIIIGHSHPECAFNDALVPNLKNISQSGESYFYNYIKLKPVMIQNPSIDVVFVEYTNHQINERMDKWIWGDEYISDRYPKYSSFMNMSDNFMLLKNNPSAYSKALSLSIREKSTRIFENDVNYSTKIGGYLYLKRDKTDSLINNIASLKQSTNTGITSKIKISEANLSYLDAIIQFIENQNKKVILIRSPQHKKYLGYSNEQEYLEILKTRYTDTEYMDFSDFPLSNSMYGDLEHLNHKGAKVFSQWFSNLIDDGLLEKENKQDYINKRMKAEMHNKELK